MAINRERHHRQGFTLLEVFLSVALVGILAYASYAASLSFRLASDLDLSSFVLIQSLRRAQLLSQGNSQDSKWGVKTENERIVIFEGESYATRNANQDEIIEFPAELVVSGDTEIVFSKFFGELDGAKSVTLEADSGPEREISINKKGAISY